MTYPQQGPMPGGGAYYPGMQPQVQKKGRGLAITSLVLGLLGCILGLIPILGFVSFPLGAVGIVFGLIGLSGNREGKGMAIAGTILSVLAIVLAVVGIVIVNNAVNDLGDTLDDASGNSTSSILQNDIEVQLGTYATDGNEFLESGKLSLTITNKTDEKHSYSIKIEAKNSAGVRIADDTVYVSDLAPNQTVSESAFNLETGDMAQQLKSAKFEVVEASKT